MAGVKRFEESLTRSIIRLNSAGGPSEFDWAGPCGCAEENAAHEERFLLAALVRNDNARQERGGEGAQEERTFDSLSESDWVT
jgi:hypothetical protein